MPPFQPNLANAPVWQTQRLLVGLLQVLPYFHQHVHLGMVGQLVQLFLLASTAFQYTGPKFFVAGCFECPQKSTQQDDIFTCEPIHKACIGVACCPKPASVNRKSSCHSTMGQADKMAISDG